MTQMLYRRLLIAVGIFAAFSISAGNGQAQDTCLYYFTSASCAPCKKMVPVIQQLERKGFKVYTVDLQRQPDWARHFNVSSTPTSIIVSDNREYGRQSGVIAVERLEAALIKSTQLARQRRSPSTQVAASVNTNVKHHIQRSATQPARQTSSNQTAVANVSPASENYVSTQPTMSPRERAFRATVRLRVEDDEGISHGTGTIIHVQNQHALVITCGHIFRDAGGRGIITVDYGFGSQQLQRASAKLLASDWGSRDVALVAFSLHQTILPAPIGSSSFLPRPGDAVFSVGCSKGRNPTVADCRVKRSARYGLPNSSFMAMKIDTTVRPVDGRSGGGLFDSAGRLIGVCNAAAQDEDEGIYSALENVFWQLDKSNLAKLFRNSVPSKSTQLVAQTQHQPSSPNTIPTTAMPAEEWVITVRSSRTGEQFTLSNPSPQLLQRIASESSSLSRNQQRVATLPQDMPDVRGMRLENRQQYRAQSPR